MRPRTIITATLGFMLAPLAAGATPVQVVQHHVDAMKRGDLAGVMRDYAADAIVVTPEGLVQGQRPVNGPGVFAGAAQARRVFVTLLDRQHFPGVRSMQTQIEPAGPGVALLRWTQFKGTPQQVTGKDVFVVRGNRITYQVVLPDPAR